MLAVILEQYRTETNPHFKWRVFDSETGEILFDDMYNFNIAWDKCLEHGYKPVGVEVGVVY